MISRQDVWNGARAREVVAIFAFTLIACAAMAMDKAHVKADRAVADDAVEAMARDHRTGPRVIMAPATRCKRTSLRRRLRRQ